MEFRISELRNLADDLAQMCGWKSVQIKKENTYVHCGWAVKAEDHEGWHYVVSSLPSKPALGHWLTGAVTIKRYFSDKK